MQAHTKAIQIHPHELVHPLEVAERVEEARMLFQRTLSKWAGDMLVLRSQSMQGPRWPGQIDPWFEEMAA